MKKLLTILLMLLVVSAVQAETPTERACAKHELRIGWGDQLFESLIWHDPASVITSMPADYYAVYQEDHHYIQHIFAEYHYRSNHWFSVGLLLDGSAVTWTDVTRNGLGEEIQRDPGRYFMNIAIVPTFRATYFSRRYLNFYSGFGLGLLVNGGTETDSHGHHTLAAPAFNVTLFGLSVNAKRFFITAEYGGMYSLLDSDTIFLAKSRMFAASLGFRF